MAWDEAEPRVWSQLDKYVEHTATGLAALVTIFFIPFAIVILPITLLGWGLSKLGWSLRDGSVSR